MKINRVQNYQQSYKGLNLDGLSAIHFNYIKPCKPQLQELAQKADIIMNSRWNPFLQAEILEYAVKPLTSNDANKNVLRWGCLGTGYTKISPDIVIQRIISEIKKV